MVKKERERMSSRLSRRLFLASCASCALISTSGCAVFKGGPSNPAANREAADVATSGVMKELARIMKATPSKKPVVCFLGVTGGSNAADLSSMTRELLEEGSFTLIKKSDTQEALKESGVRANNVFIPTERKKFIEALGTDFDYLLAGYVEKVGDDYESENSDDNFTAAHNAPKKRRVYRLELVNVETNEKSTFTADL